MSRDMSIYAMAGYLKRLSELPEDRMLKARPRKLRRINVLENKSNPDFYVAGLVLAFMGMGFFARWYPVLSKRDGAAAFRKGIEDCASGKFCYADILGDLWRVRRTDQAVFDAAIYLKHGGVAAEEIIAAIRANGEMEFLKRENGREHEMELYGLIDDEWLDHRKHAKEQERETEDAQL